MGYDAGLGPWETVEGYYVDGNVLLCLCEGGMPCRSVLLDPQDGAGAREDSAMLLSRFGDLPWWATGMGLERTLEVYGRFPADPFWTLYPDGSESGASGGVPEVAAYIGEGADGAPGRDDLADGTEGRVPDSGSPESRFR